MRTYLNWLHISDIHFHAKTEWRDSHVRNLLLSFLKNELANKDALKPDLIFCTDDIAFGEADSDRLDEQYAKAIAFFDELRAVCGRNGISLPIERLFVVPGNHDIDRNSIDPQVLTTLHDWAEKSRDNSERIKQQFNDRRYEVGSALRRLAEYERFVKNYLPHQYDENGRCCVPDTSTQFKDNRNGTITDTVTQFMWQQTDDGIERNWTQATSYCESLNLGGHGGWRLPTTEEFKTIIDETRQNPSIDTTYFPNTKSANYWTCATNGKARSNAWIIGFVNGYMTSDLKTNKYFVRCVR